MPQPPHSPWLDLPNDIWESVQTMKILVLFSSHYVTIMLQIKWDEVAAIYNMHWRQVQNLSRTPWM
jgi:hypothetical protein